ncbi:MAG: hypothetical protein QOD14_2300 [Solirubrobacterales bacterium]|jgi:hypothetical protein|nr:hypothetical protein [Solirubrobacterales bacterium]
MRTKLTALLVMGAALVAGAAVAHAAPIPVATYTFQSQDDVNAFQKVSGGSCKRKWAGNQALGIGVGNATNSCVYRSSVVADSSDQYADQGMVATATVGGGTPKLQKKSFVGVGVRHSDSAGYLLRVLPNAHKWQYFRDPKGAAGPKLVGSGSGKFVKLGSKPNTIALRAFSYGGNTTSVVGSVNGVGVVSTTDSGADQPDGRQTVVASGAKGSAAGTGITGVFDNVMVQVPNPF